MVSKELYKSKWGLIGITPKKLKKIYSKNRLKAYTQLKDNHKKEYSIILNQLMFKEYLIISTGYELLPFGKQIRIKEILKGGLKK
jgi:hypothetical protein